MTARCADPGCKDPAHQARIAGTSRPESAPRIRTEGREADGPLFTQDRDAHLRAEARSQRPLFAGPACDWCGENKPTSRLGCPRCGCRRCLLDVCADCTPRHSNPIGAECRCCSDEPFEADE